MADTGRRKPLIIAVDGPASSGKGTVARTVALLLGYQYIDTGAMYRAVALVARERGISWDAEDAVAEVAAGLHFAFSFDGELLQVLVDGRDVTADIRQEHIGQGASDVSRHPTVRRALLGLQRALARRGGVVMDGRDIGTVVLPDADLKVYLDAKVEERAQRRHAELSAKGEVVGFGEVLEALRARDKQDMERPVAPLCQAEDAVFLDSTHLTIEEGVDAVLELAKARGAKAGGAGRLD
ncbi:MAG: (d)CMP kinase [Deltaproteobacteria bacterium]|nr:(d)CMP kinase [Deltaproteobacteria bacterium]